MYSRRVVQHGPPNRPAPVIDPLVVPTVDEQEVALPDGLPPPPPDDVEVLAVCDVEPDVPCVAVPVDPFGCCVEACDPPVTGEPLTGADGTGAVPLTCAGETMVRVGPAKGSVPQDDDVDTPLVAFCEVAQGMSGMEVIGALRPLDDAVPDVDAPVCAVGEPGTLGAASPGVPGVSVCARTGASAVSHRMVARMNRRSIALLLFENAVSAWGAFRPCTANALANLPQAAGFPDCEHSLASKRRRPQTSPSPGNRSWKNALGSHVADFLLRHFRIFPGLVTLARDIGT
jgi:hypothetical protein